MGNFFNDVGITMKELLNITMGKLRFDCELDGLDVKVIFSIHSLDRSGDRFVDPYTVLNTLDASAEHLFAGKVNELMVIRDFDRNLAVLFEVDDIDGDLELKIVTLYHNAASFRQGSVQKVIVVENKISNLMSYGDYQASRVIKL